MDACSTLDWFMFVCFFRLLPNSFEGPTENYPSTNQTRTKHQAGAKNDTGTAELSVADHQQQLRHHRLSDGSPN